MAVCPNGHDSVSTDFCDVCGHLMSGAPASTPSPAAAAPATAAPVVPAGVESESGPDTCPVCGEPRSGRFCEGCSYDFVSGVGSVATPAPASVPAPADTGWVAVVSADRAYYDLVRAQGEPDGAAIPFPENYPERSVSLSGERIRIGRRSRSRNETPEIDLGEPPEDPGVSHRHAVLVAAPDGGWTVLDTKSTNGTTVNDGVDPIESERAVPVGDGDRIHVGAWTTITLRKASEPGAGT